MNETDKTSRKDPAMSPNAERYDPRQDEIDLVDLWRALVRQKWVFGTIVLLTMLGAGTYLLTASPVYESRAMIQIGQVAIGQVAIGQDAGNWTGGRFLEDANSFVRRLQEMSPENRGGALFASVSIVDRPAAGIISMTVRGQNGPDAQRHLASGIEPIVAEHAAFFDAEVALLAERRARLQRQIEGLQEQMNLLQGEVPRLRAVSPVQASVLLLEVSNLTRQLPDLEDQVEEINERFLESRTYPTRLISGPTLPESPVEPKTQLILALAVVLGLILGLFGAFFAEFLRVARSSQ